MTDIASTSSSGQSARQYPQPFGEDVLGRVDIAIVMRAAMRTRPRADIKRLCLGDETTLGTSLRRRKPTVTLHESLAISRCLVFQKRNQHSPTRIGHSPR